MGRALGLFGVLGLLGPAPALAQGLSVAPVQVQLSARERSALVSVHNERPDARRYQLSVFRWGQSASGEMELTPTKDVVVFPLLVTVGPGERRNIRVGTTAAAGPTQKTYRLFIEELPPPARPGESAVQVLTRIGIPLFVAPTQQRVSAQVGTPRVQGGALSFELHNAGTVFVRPESIEASAVDERGARLFEHRWQPWYVLAGSTRRYEVALPKDGCARVRRVNVRVLSAAGDQHQTLDTPRGACAP